MGDLYLPEPLECWGKFLEGPLHGEELLLGYPGGFGRNTFARDDKELGLRSWYEMGTWCGTDVTGIPIYEMRFIGISNLNEGPPATDQECGSDEPPRMPSASRIRKIWEQALRTMRAMIR